MSYWSAGRDWDTRFGAYDSYGSLNFTEQSPVQVFTEPITLADAAAYLRISPPQDDTDEANQLLNFITGAREQAEILQQKDLVRKQLDLSFDYWPGYRIELREPLVSVDLVQYMDSNAATTVLVENINYIVDKAKAPGVIMPPYNGTWPTFTPWPSSALLFRFTSGYSCDHPFWRDAGARIKVGMKLLISQWFNNRLPFELGATVLPEYDFAVTSCLSYGAKVRAR